ncbi:hypothetical protein [Actinopolymorpha alba]|uniref:hypothetical protein n=1 Tax=Actinopolymorpha alba TaxID=533267 RepID=UPI000366347A|nr:hypothetical protein [Actinopolymorpha alba]
MPITATRAGRRPRALYAGFVLSAIVTLVPLVDLVTADSVAGHVRRAYPDWTADLVSADRNAIVGYLTVVGVLGLVGWLWTIWAVTRHKRWAPAAVTVMFVLGVCVALLNLGFSGGAYTNVIPYTYGTLGLLPVIPGLVAVLRVWQRHNQPDAS